MAKAARCTVTFVGGGASGIGATAVLMYRGRSLNVINYPKGVVLTKKTKAAARRRLMKGCVELSRGRR